MRSPESSFFLVIIHLLLLTRSNQFSLRNCTLSLTLNQTGRQKASCVNMGFIRVPSWIPPVTKVLDLSRNNIAEIKEGDFRNLTSLITLYLSNNKISRIEDGAFQKLTKLETLHMINNELRHVTRGLLQGLVGLAALRLDGNQIDTIEQWAFLPLSNLRSLNVARNQLKLTKVIKPIFKLPNLFELFIGKNDLSSFHSYNLSSTTLKLQRLDLSYNPLQDLHITGDIFPLLTYLDLSYCGRNGSFKWTFENGSSLETLNVSGLYTSEEKVVQLIHSFNSSLKTLEVDNITTSSFEKFLGKVCIPSLTVLHLKKYQVPTLTKHFFRPCSRLQEIHIGDNAISNMSSLTFQGLTELRLLKLQYNQITDLQNSTGDLSNLKYLDLSSNKIKKLNCFVFRNLTHLQRLSLKKNYIFDIEPHTFQHLSNLKELFLGKNKLLSLGQIFHDSLPLLKMLDLNGNKISELKEGTFYGLHSLKVLVLSDNQIAVIAKNAFRGLKSLSKLFLIANKISQYTIEKPGVFLGMPHLRVLKLANNHITFDSEELKNPPFSMLRYLNVLGINSQNRGIQSLPSNLLKGLRYLSRFEGGNLNLHSVHHDLFKPTPYLEFLDLTKNVLTKENSLPPSLFYPIPRLLELRLSQSRLPSLNFILTANLSKLVVLKVTDNQLQGFNQTLVESLPQLQYLDLQNNTFICDCSNAWFLNWSQNSNITQVPYVNKFECSYPTALKNLHLDELDMDSCTINYEFMFFIYSFSLVVLTLFISFMYNFMRWQLVYTYYLFLAFLYDSRRQHQQGFQYDAFVSYNSQDELWVLQEMLPHLEDDQGWRLCLHHRDFEPGKPIIDNIVDGIYHSRKTICVITRSYLQSEWCSREIQVASFRLFDEKKDVLILVFLEDIPAHQLSPYHRMRKLVKERTYLSWPRAGEDATIFWQKLKMAMNATNAENPILLGKEN